MSPGPQHVSGRVTRRRLAFLQAGASSELRRPPAVEGNPFVRPYGRTLSGT